MIQEHYDMSLAEKMQLLLQHWPTLTILLIAVVVSFIVHHKKHTKH